MIPKHIQMAMEVIQLHDAEKAKTITEEGQKQLALLRSKLLEEFEKLPLPEMQDPFNLL